MLGWQIFVHSVRMVFGNLKQVLQITVGPALIATIIIVGLVMALDIPPEAFDENAGGFLIFVWVVMFVTISWILVSWHRFILLKEYPTGIFPTFRFGRILAYIGHILMLWILMLGMFGILMMIAYIIQMILVFAVSGENLAGFSVILQWLPICLLLFLLVCVYRLSIILSAAAIGNPVSLRDAWNNTTGVNGTILLLLLVLGLVQLPFTALAIIPGLGPVLGGLLAVFDTLILSMINVSIATTMYGIFIEKRQLF